MKIEMLTGSRRFKVVEVPDEDANKLIKKGMAKAVAKKAPAKKKTTKKD